MKCLAELEQALAVVEGFRKPTVKYEQYATDAHLAGKNNIQIAFLSFYRPLQQLARTLFTAEQQFDDISGKVIADLGCGPGIFTIGSMLLGSKMNFAFDVDENVFLVATRNAALLGLINEEIVIESSSSEYSERYDSYSEDSESEQSDSDASSTAEGGTTSACDSLSGTFDAALKLNEEKILEFIHIDVATLSDGLRPSCLPLVDVTFTNPPFGTKNNTGIDMLFLKMAIHISKQAVYSYHKSSTRSYVLKKAKEWGVKGTVLAEMSFDIPKNYKFHKKDILAVQVDLLRFEI